MCFSVTIDKDIRKLGEIFHAQPLPKEFQYLADLQEFEKQAGPEKMKEILGLKRKSSTSHFKTPVDDGRVFPNTFAPVIVMENGKRVIKPMRYRVRPAGSGEEIPSKYNVFNARIDSLEKRKTWSGLFMRHHALFPFHNFYEWVEDENGKKRLINFRPDNADMMWAPALWDEWQSRDGSVKFSSFAIVTDDPPPEVEEMGHDRCPIFLKEDKIDQWLQPMKLDKQAMYELLRKKEQTHFVSKFN